MIYNNHGYEFQSKHIHFKQISVCCIHFIMLDDYFISINKKVPYIKLKTSMLNKIWQNDLILTFLKARSMNYECTKQIAKPL